MTENSEAPMLEKPDLSLPLPQDNDRDGFDRLNGTPAPSSPKTSISLDSYIRHVPSSDENLVAIYGKAAGDNFFDMITTRTPDGKLQPTALNLLKSMIDSKCNPDEQKNGINCFWVSSAVIIHKLFLHHCVEAYVSTTGLMESLNRFSQMTLVDIQQGNATAAPAPNVPSPNVPALIDLTQISYTLNLFTAIVQNIWKAQLESHPFDDWLQRLRIESLSFGRGSHFSSPEDIDPQLLEEQFLLRCGQQSRYGICLYKTKQMGSGHAVIARVPSGGGKIEYYDFQDGRLRDGSLKGAPRLTGVDSRDATKSVKILVPSAKQLDCQYKAFHWFNYIAPEAYIEPEPRFRVPFELPKKEMEAGGEVDAALVAGRK